MGFLFSTPAPKDGSLGRFMIGAKFENPTAFQFFEIRMRIEAQNWKNEPGIGGPSGVWNGINLLKNLECISIFQLCQNHESS